jgi:hypothetical protein
MWERTCIGFAFVFALGLGVALQATPAWAQD